MDYKTFSETRMVQDAVIRQIEIIGEATKNLSKDARELYGNIPGKDMAGMRDKLIHDYFGVDIAAAWKTVEDDIPFLKQQIKNVIDR